MIDKKLRERFEKVLGIKNLDFGIIDKIAMSDANISRPIKGVCFETYLVKMLKRHKPGIDIVDGQGDSDVDLSINGVTVQAKTPVDMENLSQKTVQVALHKTHGDETRPNNLYKQSNPVFDVLCVLHPSRGIMLVPWEKIPLGKVWEDYLSDPAKFDFDNEFLNSWELVKLPEIREIFIDDRSLPTTSELPYLSSLTYLEDFEIIETLCKPEYFRAAVMGLKGNLKEAWFSEMLKQNGYSVSDPVGSYPKYDVAVTLPNDKYIRIQTKGTSEGYCDVDSLRIGVEVMGTHGQFPRRGYQKSMFDYLAIVISEHQLPSEYAGTGLHFLLIPVDDLPIHYRVNRGALFSNLAWDDSGFRWTLYPNIKLKGSMNAEGRLSFVPDLGSYKTNKDVPTIPLDSNFRSAGPYTLDSLDLLSMQVSDPED